MGRPGRLTGTLVAVAAGGLLVLLAWQGVKASLSGLFSAKTTVEERFFNHQEFTRELAVLILAEKKVTEMWEKSERFERWYLHFVTSEALYEVRYTVLYSVGVAANPEQWRIRDTREGIAVTAPRLAMREPAIDTGTIRARRQGGWLIFNQEATLEAMRQRLTVHARERAAQHLDTQMIELCRHSLRQFLSGWLRRLGDARDITTIEFTR